MMGDPFEEIKIKTGFAGKSKWREVVGNGTYR
jgi:hypothetical protein